MSVRSMIVLLVTFGAVLGTMGVALATRVTLEEDLPKLIDLCFAQEEAPLPPLPRPGPRPLSTALE